MKKFILGLLTGILLSIIPSTFAIIAAPMHFSDVNEGDWYYGIVNALYEGGYTSGYEDGSFRPNNAITRAETAKFIVTLDEFIQLNRSNISELTDKVEILEAKISTLDFPGECYYNDTWYSTGDTVEDQPVSTAYEWGTGECICQADGTLEECIMTEVETAL
jgi:hypothetical protein